MVGAVSCFYCERPVYLMAVCREHWVRFLRTTYGYESPIREELR